jgi:hypothetical protein
MGLDMYAFAVPAAQVGDQQVDVQLPESAREFAYWRKFNHLHGWMNDLYKEKGGADADFNCNTVRLTEVDLRHLEEALDEGALKHRPGFFFGGSEADPEDIEATRTFIAAARESIAAGEAVFYDSWW